MKNYSFYLKNNILRRCCIGKISIDGDSKRITDIEIEKGRLTLPELGIILRYLLKNAKAFNFDSTYLEYVLENLKVVDIEVHDDLWYYQRVPIANLKSNRFFMSICKDGDLYMNEVLNIAASVDDAIINNFIVTGNSDELSQIYEVDISDETEYFCQIDSEYSTIDCLSKDKQSKVILAYVARFKQIEIYKSLSVKRSIVQKLYYTSKEIFGVDSEITEYLWYVHQYHTID